MMMRTAVIAVIFDARLLNLLQSLGASIRGTVMAIPQDLLEILVCPVCKIKVAATADNAGLECPQCRRVYPIRDDIPVMLPEEAKIAQP
jgi:uncharacterized protein YbaR (Trm112 family)